MAQVEASLAWGPIKNHAFTDDNKRIGFMAMVTFLEVNGSQLGCSEEEETAKVLQAAAGEITEEQ